MSVDSRPADLHLTTPSFSASGPELRAARDRSWYATTNFGLAVLRHSEVGQLLKDPRLRQGSGSWPAQNGITGGVLHDWWQQTLVSVDAADHTRLRRLVNPAFSRSAIERMTASFRELAADVADRFVDSGSCEFMADFAEPYSSRALCRLLGIPEDDWKQLSDEAADLGLAFGPEIVDKLPQIEAAILALDARADDLVATRRAEPRDDFVSRLMTVAGDRDGLSDRELRELIAQLIFGGMDTTRSQLGLAMHLFVEHPHQWSLLAGQPELGARAVEEAIRFHPAINWVTRLCTEDFTFQGVDIAEGTVLHLMTYAAGTDPLAIGESEFDITAERAAHYGFGGGRHHCLGHFVARVDLREALLELAPRMVDPAYTGAPRFRPPTGNTGPIAMPMTFTPGRRETL